MRILIADDDPLFAESLTTLIGADEGIEVVGHARDGEEALALVEELRPDLVLMDLAMPGMPGLEATRRIRAEHPQTLVLILTGYGTSEDVRAATDAGASGFLTKDSLSTETASAIVGLASFAGGSRV